MNALVLVFTALLVFAIGYRFYGIFLARKVLMLDAGRATPAIILDDGHDYQPTNKYVLFGHHFAAIAAAGPLLLNSKQPVRLPDDVPVLLQAGKPLAKAATASAD